MSSIKPEASVTAIGQYFDAVDENINIHGENTAVFMLIGDFYEMYVKYNKETDTHYGSNLWELKDILQCQRISETKKTKLENGDILKMWGVPQSSIEDKKNLLVNNNYNIILYDQRKDDKGKVIERYISEKITPGTFIAKDDSLIDITSNNVSCLILKSYKIGTITKIGYGYSNFDVFTGHTSLFDGSTESLFIDHTTFNDLEHNLISNVPRELLILTNLDNKVYEQIKKAMGCGNLLIKKYDMNDIKSKNCFKPEYIKKTINSVFTNSEYFNEFEYCELATSSLCFLIDYVNIYTPLALSKISDPNLIDNERLILANHTHQQLNIISDNQKNKLSSVLSNLNNCVSVLGKRNFKNQLLNPTKNIEKLNKEYDIIDYITNANNIIHDVRNKLKYVSDTDYLLRKITTNKSYPRDLYKLYISFDSLKDVRDDIIGNNNHTILKYIYSHHITHDIFQTSLNELLTEIDNKLNIKMCDITDIKIEDIGLIKDGYDSEYDKMKTDYKNKNDLIRTIICELNRFLKIEFGDNTDYIQEHVYEKNACDLKITSSRTDKVTALITRMAKHHSSAPIITFNINSSPYSIDFRDLVFKKKDKTNNIIHHKLINDTYEELYSLKTKLVSFTTKVFADILDNLVLKYYDKIERLSSVIGIIDATICKAYNSKKMNYCKPIIQEHDKSFVNVKGLRHQLIEQLLDNEVYVSNDIELGKDKNGLLLYGTNAVGKTSFIRALGISVIMAQAGMYVPAESFVYNPYSSIYSRILGNDNLFKGLSTFQVEISELRTIEKYADKNSLILGDEICSGTEHDSALCINACGLIHLNNVNSTYIFATHLHELVDIEEVNALEKLYVKHMTVVYDNERGDLIYERKFKDGSGDRTYGLEVIKSVLSKKFVDNCYDMRNKLCGQNILFLDSKKSNYNAKYLKTSICELCNKNSAVDIHHIEEQQNANANGFIGTINKNCMGNIINLCKSCHLKQTDDSDMKIIKKVKTTHGYKLLLQSGTI